MLLTVYICFEKFILFSHQTSVKTMHLIIWADPHIRTIRQLDALISETYTLAIILVVLFLGIAIALSNRIAYEGGKNPSDPAKRRTWFFILGVAAPVLFFLFNYLYVKQTIENPALQTKFVSTNVMGTVLVLALYFLIGFLLSKILKNSKFATIFPTKKA
jgi:methionine sulfoxide reductase heme-binding subunit